MSTMSTTITITAETTTDDIRAHLDALGSSYSVEHGGAALQIERAAAGDILLVHWDDQDPRCEGWAWRCGGDSGSLDSYEELDRLLGTGHILDATHGQLRVGSRVCWDIDAPHIEHSMVHGPRSKATGKPVPATGTVAQLSGRTAVLVRWDDGSRTTAHGSWLELL